MKKYAYLLKIEPDANANKFYRMTDLENGRFRVEYGRVGNKESVFEYGIEEWDKKYNEKRRKGYIDKTELSLVSSPSSSNFLSGIENSEIREFVGRLLAYAKKAVEDNYTIVSNAVTQRMVDEAQSIINNIATTKSVGLEYVNRRLLDLFRVIPRKMDKVSKFLVVATQDIQKVLEREQDLLDVMRGQIVSVDVSEQEKTENILDSIGVRISPISPKDKNIILSELGSESRRYRQGWVVENKKTRSAFNHFLKENGLTKEEVRLLWHGSRNENWWNITRSGLLINPPAKTTGKMFGYGIYFAPKASKSVGYTSVNGSYWAKGDSSVAIMSLYEVGYGNPYNVYDAVSMTAEELTKRKCHSLHAHAGNALRNDEIVVYRESQTTIKYMVEIS